MLGNEYQNFLDVVNEDDRVVGKEKRIDIHKQGLLHREVHVLFYTPQGEIVLQKRAEDKETLPGVWDSTVGGHVELGQDYDEAALMETQEETGLVLHISDLKKYKKIRRPTVQVSDDGLLNNTWDQIYLYKFEENINQLQIEEGKADGFGLFNLNQLLNDEYDHHDLSPDLYSDEFKEVYKYILNLLKPQN